MQRPEKRFSFTLCNESVRYINNDLETLEPLTLNEPETLSKSQSLP
jgi:hypothetical protein